MITIIEKTYTFTTESDAKIVEKIVSTDDVQIIHMIFKKGDSTPTHYANSNVYLIVVDGEMTLTLEDQEPKLYPAGTIINVPYNTKMLVENKTCENMEFFVIKAPHPLKLGAPEAPRKVE